MLVGRRAVYHPASVKGSSSPLTRPVRLVGQVATVTTAIARRHTTALAANRLLRRPAWRKNEPPPPSPRTWRIKPVQVVAQTTAIRHRQASVLAANRLLQRKPWIKDLRPVVWTERVRTPNNRSAHVRAYYTRHRSAISAMRVQNFWGIPTVDVVIIQGLALTLRDRDFDLALRLRILTLTLRDWPN